MLVTELYNGQGFGNQLWSYVFTRVLALDKNVDWTKIALKHWKEAEVIDRIQLIIGPAIETLKT